MLGWVRGDAGGLWTLHAEFLLVFGKMGEYEVGHFTIERVSTSLVTVRWCYHHLNLDHLTSMITLNSRIASGYNVRPQTRYSVT